ncbi:MAG TPA: methylmalonyl Co-A mutase-associated GTPase MeaB [Casimicrobiaceae bacterium]|jgi:LAO/AO transport system kinase|nr:methylmalonyl Co-A mutase-associated GTPase MeaB [Casimicrobiaceae bacterium]
MRYVPSPDLAPRVLAGDTRAIARLLTRAESGVEEARSTLDAMFAHAGRAHVVGITGVPGSGKSTLVAKLAAAVRRSGRKIAIVAVDPSSPFSGGSILGDRIRMSELIGDPGVFVRSMATRGALGGLAKGTLEAVDVLDAAGFDMVVIETVGVGQDEVEVARAAHTTVVVSAPGLGDDIQAIKAGILEIADIHAVSKCDKPDANRTLADLKNMLALGLTSVDRKAAPDSALPQAAATASGRASGNVGSGAPSWRPPVIATSSVRDEGVERLLDAIDGHRAALEKSGDIDVRRAAIAERRLLAAGEAILREQFARHRDGKLSSLLEQLRERSVSPNAAARQLLHELHIGGDR